MTYSLYIPRISSVFEQKDISNILAMYNIASVRRVDFVPLVVSNDDWCSAFVHCFHVEPSVWNVLDSGKSYKLQATLSEYWILLKNKNPILDTRLNIHQVVENARILEERVLKQDAIIQKQTEQIDRLQETVYQLLGGTFCQRTEMKKIFSNFNYMKWGVHCNNRWINSEKEALEEMERQKIEYYEYEEETERQRIERELDKLENDKKKQRELDYDSEEEFQGYESDPYDINFDHEG
jgi:hypothetical protein